LVGSRRRRPHDLARRDIRIPWRIARGGRVGPTSFRRRVLRRWRRVWSDFGANHQKSCKENEKGRDESLKTEGPNRKEEDREEKGGSQRKARNPKRRKKRSKENIPQRMLQTING